MTHHRLLSVVPGTSPEWLLCVEWFESSVFSLEFHLLLETESNFLSEKTFANEKFTS